MIDVDDDDGGDNEEELLRALGQHSPVLSGKVLLPGGKKVTLNCVILPQELYEEIVAVNVDQCLSENKPLIKRIQNMAKIKAIKEVRTELRCGLKEAKQLVDYLEAKGFWVPFKSSF